MPKHPQLPNGTKLSSGRYTVLETLEGGVYRCHAEGLAQESVVVKLIDESLLGNPVELIRFNKEIEASFTIQHPNVLRAYEIFRDGPLLGYSMEYVSGGDLGGLLGETAEFPIELAYELLLQISSGLEEIHRHGIVHRDLKPENVLITEDLVAKISDFGFAYLLGSERLTQTGHIVGTVHYTPPEYLISGELDFLSDVYAFGVLGFRVLTNEFPFRGSSIGALFEQIQRATPFSVQAFRPDCPTSLARVIERAMSREKGDRFQSVSELRAALAALSTTIRNRT